MDEEREYQKAVIMEKD